MTAAVRPGTPAGASTNGELRPLPTRREVAALLLEAFPHLTTSAANRSARRATGSADPYQVAMDDVRRRIAAGELYSALGYADPTGNRAVSNVMRGRVA